MSAAIPDNCSHAIGPRKQVARLVRPVTSHKAVVYPVGYGGPTEYFYATTQLSIFQMGI
jgi:hypothetical protein